MDLGFIVDLAVTPQWNKAHRDAVDYFNEVRNHPYQAASLPFVTRDENAWVYYSRAAQLLDQIPNADQETIFYCLRNTDQVGDAENIVKRYAQAIAVWDTGSTCLYCTIPLQYEKGMNLSPSFYPNLRNLSRLVILKARVEVREGNSQAAAETYAKALKLAADIGGGEAFLPGTNAAIDIGTGIQRQLIPELSAFDLEGASSLNDALGQIERRWPRLESAIEAEGWSYLLPTITGWDGCYFYHFLYKGMVKNLYEIFPPSWVTFRIIHSALSWSHFFSVRLAVLKAGQRLIFFKRSCDRIPDKKWGNLKMLLADFDANALKDLKRLDISGIPIPNIFKLYWKDYTFLMALRVIRCGLYLKEYKLNHNCFPGDMNGFLSSDTTYYDIADNKPLHFTRDSTSQVIRLYSIGLNLKDNKGQGDPADWLNKDNDDIWVEVK